MQVSAINTCVSTTISEDIKHFFIKKKDILNFAFPKSIVSLPTIVKRNVNKNVNSNNSSYPIFFCLSVK